MNRLSITVFSLLLATTSIAQQTNGLTNSLALWVSGGYNNFLSNVEQVKNVGAVGGNVGLGYDLQSGGFLMQLGVEYQHYTSNAFMDDFSETVPMLNTESNPYDGIFRLKNNREKQTMGNAAAVMKFGFITPNNFYMLFGGKYAYSIYGTTATYTTVTSKAYYDHLIGDINEKEEGIFSDMPNHDYFTEKRKFSQKLGFKPTVFGSVEAGMKIEKWNLWGATYRLALFCDFGITTLTNKSLPNTSRLINTSKTEAFRPALRPFAYNEQTDRIPVLFAGIKLTMLFGSQNNGGYCNCIQDVKYQKANKKYRK